MANEQLTKDQLLKYLSDDRNLFISWIQRKEVAAWSAIIFHVAFIWTFYNAILSDETLHFQDLLISLFIVILVGYIVFRFIHSQYASIYHRIAYTQAITKIIHDLMREDFDVTKMDFSFDSEIRQPRFLSSQFLTDFNHVQPFRGKIHPIAILLRFWFYWLYFLLTKIFKKRNPKKLNNPAKQEASLYSLIILVTIIFSYFALRQL